jgi:hypothetical protein
MMSPRAYEDARRLAPVHAQVWVGGARPSERDPASVKVRGRVVRVFRDETHRLRFGERVSFSVPLMGAPGGPRMASAEIRHSWAHLGASAWWEVFLRPVADGFELALSQVAPIRRPTWRPVCGPQVEGVCCPGNLKAPM